MEAGVPIPRTWRVHLGLAFALCLLPGAAPAEWFEEHVQIHGFFTSNLYTRSPDMSLAQEARISSWRNELNVEVGNTIVNLQSNNSHVIQMYNGNVATFSVRDSRKYFDTTRLKKRGR